MDFGITLVVSKQPRVLNTLLYFNRFPAIKYIQIQVKCRGEGQKQEQVHLQMATKELQKMRLTKSFELRKRVKTI